MPVLYGQGMSELFEPQQAAQIAAEYDRALALDRQLTFGLLVQARWTQTGHAYRGEGEVVRISEQTVTVRLNEQVQASWGQPFRAGFEVLLPRPLSPRWSPSNGAFPAS